MLLNLIWYNQSSHTFFPWHWFFFLRDQEGYLIECPHILDLSDGTSWWCWTYFSSHCYSYYWMLDLKIQAKYFWQDYFTGDVVRSMFTTSGGTCGVISLRMLIGPLTTWPVEGMYTMDCRRIFVPLWLICEWALVPCKYGNI